MIGPAIAEVLAKLTGMLKTSTEEALERLQSAVEKRMYQSNRRKINTSDILTEAAQMPAKRNDVICQEYIDSTHLARESIFDPQERLEPLYDEIYVEMSLKNLLVEFRDGRLEDHLRNIDIVPLFEANLSNLSLVMNQCERLVNDDDEPTLPSTDVVS